MGGIFSIHFFVRAEVDEEQNFRAGFGMLLAGKNNPAVVRNGTGVQSGELPAEVMGLEGVLPKGLGRAVCRAEWRFGMATRVKFPRPQTGVARLQRRDHGGDTAPTTVRTAAAPLARLFPPARSSNFTFCTAAISQSWISCRHSRRHRLSDGERKTRQSFSAPDNLRKCPARNGGR